MTWVLTTVSGAFLFYLCTRLPRLYKVVSSTRGHSRSFVFFGIKSALNVLIPGRIPFINLGLNSSFDDKYSVYGKGVDVISYISLVPKIDNSMFVADATAIKEVAFAARDGLFPKPMEFYKHFLFFGSNLLVSEGAQWKKYRKIIGPSFNERNNRLVWKETIRLMQELREEWGSDPAMIIEDSKDITFPMTLMVMMSAGFGVHTTWQDSAIPDNHRMTFQKALRVFVSGMVLKVIFPSWVMNLTSKLREVKLASGEVERYMSEMIQERRHLNLEHKHDLLSNLLRTEELDGSEESLSDGEILGNLFFLLVAAQDTTGHSLTCILALLAIYPEEQERLYRHTKSVIPDGRTPAYEDMPLLTYTLAVIYESIRLYSIIPGIPKNCTKDTTLPVQGPNGQMLSVPVTGGTSVLLNFVGLHYNPSYWEDPYAFQPQRFMKDWPRDAFVPFSLGPRGCLGRRFAETEMIAIITMLILQYRIEIKGDPVSPTETPEQRRDRIIKLNLMVTAVPDRIPFVLRRRETE